MKLELIPLLILALLLLSAGSADVQTAEFVIDGDHALTEHRGALIVGDASVTVPSDADVSGPIYVIGGVLRIEGTVSGDVTQLSGTLVVDDGGTIAGELQHVAGTERLSAGATVADRTSVEPVPTEPDPVAAFLPTALATLVLALAGALFSRRWPTLLETVGMAASEHTLVSLTVGGLVLVTFLSVFVFMAFTLVLIPVTLLGLLVGVLSVAYGILALGSLVGTRLSRSQAGLRSREGLATGIGTIVVMGFLELSSVVPFVGDLLAIGLLLTGFGAVVVTYFGLRRFEPVTLPE